MKPRIKVITLGVSDFERSLSFFRDGLGLSEEVINGTECKDGAVVFFKMNDELILALYPMTASAKDTKIQVNTSGPAGFSIGHIVSSSPEADPVTHHAEHSGTRITSHANDRFWEEYSGHFQDIDGHHWEIAWNLARETKE